MTTSTSAVPAARSTHATRAPRIAGKQTFGRAVHSELLKLTSLRSTWVSSLITILLTAGIGALVTIVGSDPDNVGETSWKFITTGTTFGHIVVAVLGALAITGEYSSGQIRSTLAAVPRRSSVFLAKACVIAAWSFVLGVVSILLAWAVSAPLVQGQPVSLGNTDLLGFVWGTGLAYAGISLMALGLGFLLRSTAGSITVVTIFLFVINIPLSIASAFWSWAKTALDFTLVSVAAAVVDPYSTTGGISGNVSHTQAVFVFIAWCLIPLIAGWLTFTRRDA